jgi:hypothetical protein
MVIGGTLSTEFLDKEKCTVALPRLKEESKEEGEQEQIIYTMMVLDTICVKIPPSPHYNASRAYCHR